MTRFMTRLRRGRSKDERGFTLTELLVSMGIFALLLALDNSRKVVTLLDKQVRYANAINTPGTGTDGNFYVEFRVGNTNQQQTCYQWRWVTTAKTLQYRTWMPDLFGGAGTPAATSWVSIGTGVSKSGATPIFDITPDTAAVTTSHELLTVMFVSTHGKPAKSTTSRVGLTAANSTSASAPVSALCNEHGRPSP
jgi:prepilin-type N-terminal cleavage/methylation domain-containing protein